MDVIKLEKIISKAPLFFLTALVISFSSLTNAYAQDSSLSLGYSPTSVAVKLNTGDSYAGLVAFWNLAPRSTTYEVHISGFEQIEESPGTARLRTAQEDANAPYSASSWFHIEQKTVTI